MILQIKDLAKVIPRGESAERKASFRATEDTFHKNILILKIKDLANLILKTKDL